MCWDLFSHGSWLFALQEAAAVEQSPPTGHLSAHLSIVSSSLPQGPDRQSLSICRAQQHNRNKPQQRSPAAAAGWARWTRGVISWCTKASSHDLTQDSRSASPGQEATQTHHPRGCSLPTSSSDSSDCNSGRLLRHSAVPTAEGYSSKHERNCTCRPHAWDASPASSSPAPC